MTRLVFLVLTIITVLSSCSKIEQVSIDKFITYIPDYTKKAFPKKTDGTINLKNQNGNIVSFVVKGGYYQTPKFPQYSNPVDFEEKFAWEIKDGDENSYHVKCSIDTSYMSDNTFIFKIQNKSFPDSVVYYRYIMLPNDVIYTSQSQLYFTAYTLDGKTYTNCYILLGSKNRAMIYSYTDGIIYFDAINGEKYTLNQ